MTNTNKESLKNPNRNKMTCLIHGGLWFWLLGLIFIMFSVPDTFYNVSLDSCLVGFVMWTVAFILFIAGFIVLIYELYNSLKLVDKYHNTPGIFELMILTIQYIVAVTITPVVGDLGYSQFPTQEISQYTDVLTTYLIPSSNLLFIIAILFTLLHILYSLLFKNLQYRTLP